MSNFQSGWDHPFFFMPPSQNQATEYQSPPVTNRFESTEQWGAVPNDMQMTWRPAEAPVPPYPYYTERVSYRNPYAQYQPTAETFQAPLAPMVPQIQRMEGFPATPESLQDFQEAQAYPGLELEHGRTQIPTEDVGSRGDRGQGESYLKLPGFAQQVAPPRVGQLLVTSGHVSLAELLIYKDLDPKIAPSIPVDYKDDSWTYAVEVWPPSDVEGENRVIDHIVAIQEAFIKKGLQYDFCIAAPIRPKKKHRGLCRRYTLPRRVRDHDRIRLNFLQVFNAKRAWNRNLVGYYFKMAVVYENRHVLQSDPYPPGIDHSSHGGHSDQGDLDDQDDRDDRNDHSDASDHGGNSDNADHSHNRRDLRVPYSPQPIVHELDAFSSANDPPLNPSLIPSSPEPTTFLAPPTPPEFLPSLSGIESDNGRPPVRSRPIAKPERRVEKNAQGKYVCTWQNCTEEIKEFTRKCEWGKHMDKHDRPYKCDLRGCEKLPGFTYSGGLLRHEREVHGKHGGPRNPLNCPHVNCKRHTGKGFSRLENLNEHLRRVHTPGDNETGVPEEREDNLSVVGPSPAPATPTIVTAMTPTERVNEKPERVGEKRKPETDLRVQVKRLQVENHNLRTQVEAQKRQQIAMMEQMQNMQEALQSFTNADQVANRATSASPAAPLLSSSGA